MTDTRPISQPPKQCPLEKYLSVMSGSWVPRILWHLLEGPRRFAALQRDLNGVSAKVLASKLRALEKEGIVQRTVYPMNPPQVEYAVTARGRAFEPVFRAMEQAANQLFPPSDKPPAIAHAQVESPRPPQSV